MRNVEVAADFKFEDFVPAEVLSELEYKQAVAGLEQLKKLERDSNE